jgi:hypothetical protein
MTTFGEDGRSVETEEHEDEQGWTGDGQELRWEVADFPGNPVLQIHYFCPSTVAFSRVWRVIAGQPGEETGFVALDLPRDRGVLNQGWNTS